MLKSFRFTVETKLEVGFNPSDNITSKIKSFNLDFEYDPRSDRITLLTPVDLINSHNVRKINLIMEQYLERLQKLASEVEQEGSEWLKVVNST